MFFGRKKTPQANEPMDLDAVMKKYDRESNTRVWEGTPKLIVRVLGILFSCYCIFSTLKGWPTLPEQKLNIFLGLILIMGYLHYPLTKGMTKPNYLPWYDIVIMALGSAPFFYFAMNAEKISLMDRGVISTNPFLLIIAVLGILALVEL